jgi:hypothetical protein
MRTGCWKYQTDDYQAPVWYRGYVEKFVGRTRYRKPCAEVVKTRGEALRQAKRLLKTLTK